MKQKFVLIASLAVGLLAAILANAWLRVKTGEVEAMKAEILENTREVRVVVATRALTQGTILTQEDLGYAKIMERAVTSDNISKDDLLMLIGRRINHSIGVKDPILWTYLDGGRDITRGFSSEILPGMRAVSIPVAGSAAVSGLVRPNDHVDVLGQFAMPDQSATIRPDAELVTMTVLQNVTVLATGSETSRSQGSRTSSSYSMVTLLVTPREAEVLVFAQQMKGRLFLSLRNPSDVHYEAETPRVDFAKITDEIKGLNEARQNTLRRTPTRRIK